MYQRGIIQHELLRQRSKEAQKIKENIERSQSSFRPHINNKSLAIASRNKSLAKRTQEHIEKQKIKQNNILCASYTKNTSTRSISPMTGPKIILTPGTEDNFYNKNMEWQKHKYAKREYLQTEQRKRKEYEENMAMLSEKNKMKENYNFDELELSKLRDKLSDRNQVIQAQAEHFGVFGDVENQGIRVQRRILFEDDAHNSNSMNPDRSKENNEVYSDDRDSLEDQENEPPNRQTRKVAVGDQIMVDKLIRDLECLKISFKEFLGSRKFN